MPAAERGATRIEDRVVAKIAAQAAHEALRSGRTGESAAHSPSATADVRRPSGADPAARPRARLRVGVELDYPCDISARCDAVRERVVRRVETLAGMSVPAVVVEVERLHSPQLRGADSGRVR
ncbi:Asp23/Gls24 family envelope stress response protein [Streptomyces sparsus]